MRDLVAYLDISDSNQAERTHQKDGKVPGVHTSHQTKKSVFLNIIIPIILHRDKKKTNNYEVGKFVYVRRSVWMSNKTAILVGEGFLNPDYIFLQPL